MELLDEGFCNLQANFMHHHFVFIFVENQNLWISLGKLTRVINLFQQINNFLILFSFSLAVLLRQEKENQVRIKKWLDQLN